MSVFFYKESDRIQLISYHIVLIYITKCSEYES